MIVGGDRGRSKRGPGGWSGGRSGRGDMGTLGGIFSFRLPPAPRYYTPARRGIIYIYIYINIYPLSWVCQVRK